MVCASANTKDIIAAIKDQLRWDESVDDREIAVDLQPDGTAVLTGYVPDFLAKRSAGIDAMLSPGVQRVKNRLIVNNPMNPETMVTADEEIRSRISTALTLQGDVDLALIRVRSHQGHVTMEGSVDSYEKLLRTLDGISRVIGVVDITNNVAVVPGRTFADGLLARNIMENLERKIDRDILNDIAVEVKEGVVRLDGAVPAKDAWARIHDAIAPIEGVKSIDSRLKIG